MKKIILLFLVLWGQVTHAQESPLLWMQQPALSPDGQWIAFEYKGNLYKVPFTGGAAAPLTINSAYNGYPVWSHDGKSIAFASDRYGNFDVFIMPSTGGNAQRLTYDSAKDIPYDFSADNKQVYFGTSRHDISSSVRFPNDNLWMKLYAVPVNGGFSQLINSAGTEYAHFDKSGNRFLFQDTKGYESAYRKHHQSPVTRDIWLYDMTTKAYLKVSDFEGEDREPVWGEGNNFYYLSERNGSQNLFSSSVNQSATVMQLTTFTKNPVRNLSRAGNGLLAFTQNGELYTLKEGETPKKLFITLAADFNTDQIKNITVKDGVTEMVASPNGKEVALVYRGEVFVAAADGSGTKRITNTAYQERMIHYSPDGRSLIYSAENGGSWDIFKASIVNHNEPYFYAATTVKIEPLIATPKDEFKGIYSPDGKSIAYLEERNVIRVYNLESKKSITVSPEGMNYSYVDGDQDFSWSPDSQCLLISSNEGYSGNSNTVLLRADGSGKRMKLTQSGFDTDSPQWGMNGKMMYYQSGKEGLKNLSQGWAQSDVYAVFFDQAAYDTFKLSKEELALRNEMAKKDSSDKAAANHPTKKGATDFELKDNVNPDILASRTIKLSGSSAQLADVKLSADGEKLYYIAKYEENCDLWVTSNRTHETKILTKLGVGQASMEMSKDGKTLFVLADGNILKIDAESGNKSTVGLNATMDLDAAAERAYVFEHTFQFLPKKFFDPKLQGVDWQYYHNQYQRFLPHINNNYDFETLLSEFLGELNSSHTGGRYRPVFPNKDETAALGLLYEVTRTGKGLLVNDVLEGGPFNVAGSKMAKGCIIDQIDGVAITGESDWASLLNHKKDKYTLINFHDPKTNIAHQEIIKPISTGTETNTLLYHRWIHKMEHLTDSLSGGKIGYVHIEEMDEGSFRETIDKIDGKSQGKKAIVIDTRFNGGGNLHEPLTAYLNEKEHLAMRPQGHTLLHDVAADGSRKPSCILMSESNYSDAFNVPYQYKRLGIGKLIGTPVAGTGTGVYWEKQIDNTLIIGVPMLGLSWVGETQLLENHQLEPDIKVYNDYSKVLNGEDQQLEAAVKELLKTL